ncbi:MAG: hypothetical protein MK033_11175 [Candidatus Caenarcaniphilales bacterium]|nr:hypothetical protein [Candidatus Caenarcaniphilales bacterium]
MTKKLIVLLFIGIFSINPVIARNDEIVGAQRILRMNKTNPAVYTLALTSKNTRRVSGTNQTISWDNSDRLTLMLIPKTVMQLDLNPIKVLFMPWTIFTSKKRLRNHAEIRDLELEMRRDGNREDCQGSNFRYVDANNDRNSQYLKSNYPLLIKQMDFDRKIALKDFPMSCIKDGTSLFAYIKRDNNTSLGDYVASEIIDYIHVH